MRYLLVLALLVVAAGCEKQTSPTTTPASTTPESTMSAALQPDIRAEEISYQVGDQTFTGFLAYDANAKEQRPGVLVVHEWWGHNEYVRTRAHMLAKMGYTAFALDMYGDGKQALHPDDAQKFMMEVMNDMPAAEARFLAAKKLLNEHPSTLPNKTAAIGYCLGGAVVLHMARRGENLQGVASFHGNLATSMPAKAHAVRAKILVLHGGDDPFVPQEQVDAFKTEMAAAVADYKFIAYPEARHGFTNPGATRLGEEFGLPLAYNIKADEESWAELDGFLKTLF